ncbi:nucleoside deaminase [Enterococcus sp. AZ192]|uniref:nucleoside deaminase n=1 Tax=unclassified Enterococcus TaxID=2608891 RepID=UPI003D2BF35A
MSEHPNEKIMTQLIHNQWTNHSITAAVIDEKMNIIAQGETTVTAIHDPTAHAEINAIREACAKLNVDKLPQDYWLYSTFEPCPLCSSAIIWSGVTGVVYANNPKYRGNEENWSFISCEEVLQKGARIQEVTLIKDFMLEDIKGYFLRHTN